MAKNVQKRCPKCTDDARGPDVPMVERLISALSEQLRAVLDMGGLGKHSGHMPHCQHGIWSGKFVPPAYPNGSPCSSRCEAAKSALARADLWMQRYGAVREAQSSMLEE